LSLLDRKAINSLKLIKSTNLALPQNIDNSKPLNGNKLYLLKKTKQKNLLINSLPTKEIKLNNLKIDTPISEIDSTSKFNIPGDKWDLKIEFPLAPISSESNEDYLKYVDNINFKYVNENKNNTEFIVLANNNTDKLNIIKGYKNNKKMENNTQNLNAKIQAIEVIKKIENAESIKTPKEIQMLKIKLNSLQNTNTTKEIAEFFENPATKEKLKEIENKENFLNIVNQFKEYIEKTKEDSKNNIQIFKEIYFPNLTKEEKEKLELTSEIVLSKEKISQESNSKILENLKKNYFENPTKEIIDQIASNNFQIKNLIIKKSFQVRTMIEVYTSKLKKESKLNDWANKLMSTQRIEEWIKNIMQTTTNTEEINDLSEVYSAAILLRACEAASKIISKQQLMQYSMIPVILNFIAILMNFYSESLKMFENKKSETKLIFSLFNVAIVLA